jgi:hypothetical protein
LDRAVTLLAEKTGGIRLSRGQIAREAIRLYVGQLEKTSGANEASSAPLKGKGDKAPAQAPRKPVEASAAVAAPAPTPVGAKPVAAKPAASTDPIVEDLGDEVGENPFSAL